MRVARSSILWDTVATALVAVASTAVKDQIAEWVPGVDEHFARPARNGRGV